MADHLVSSVISVAMAIIGLATLSVILSKNANTTGVIGASSSALNSGIATAITPITGGGGVYGFGATTGYGNSVFNLNGA